MVSEGGQALQHPSLLDALIPLAALTILIAAALALIGTWNTIPTLVYSGIQVLSPGDLYGSTGFKIVPHQSASATEGSA